ncbi:MAG: cyclophilin-like fold protein [Candidatus Methanomethylicaceae archaeon]
MSNALLEKFSIKITFQSLEATGEFVRILSPRTIESLVKVLPFSSSTFLWQDEVYFETPVSVGPERPKANVRTGDIAYWPPGKAFCIFFGKTQPYSPVNIIGKVTSDWTALKKVKRGEFVKVSLAD